MPRTVLGKILPGCVHGIGIGYDKIEDKFCTVKENNITKEYIQELINIKGETRGIAIREDVDYLCVKIGREVIERWERTMAEFGYPLKYKEIKPMDFYPIGLEAVSLLAIHKAFGFSENDFQKMGAFEPKQSLIMRFFLKYFGSLEMLAREVPKMWRKHYTTGDIEAVTFDGKERRAVLRIKDFRLHPFHCAILRGYFSTILTMVTGKQATCEETKCPFKGNESHEFLLKWQ